MRLAPRCAPVHAHHAVVQLGGRAPWTKFRIHLETRRAAETTNGVGRIFYVTLSPSDCDSPIELTHAFHISAMLAGTAIIMVAVSGAAKVIRRDDELQCRLIARALLAQTRPDAAAHRSTI